MFSIECIGSFNTILLNNFHAGQRAGVFLFFLIANFPLTVLALKAIIWIPPQEGMNLMIIYEKRRN